MRKETRYINEKTGEMSGKKVQHVDASFDEEKGYLFWNRKKFAKTFQDIDFPETMSDGDIGKMTRLAKRIWANTNMLGYRGNGGVRPYDIEGIGGIINLKKSQAYSFVQKMIRLGVIKSIVVTFEDREETQYYINPVYFFSSNRLSLNLYLLFRDELDAVLPQWVKEEFGQLRKVQ